MTNRKTRWLLVLLASCMVAAAATGCDKLKKEPQTEAVTEKVTETETETEIQTEKVTEAVTEKVTEPPTETEPETQAPVQTEPRVLTTDEEKAEQISYDQYKFMYAVDDVNVRDQPGTDGEVFFSFNQGERVTVIGETPNWAVVLLEEYDSQGYVSKQFLSDSEVAEKTSEEREQAIMEELGLTSETGAGTVTETPAGTDASQGTPAVPTETPAASTPVSTDTSSVDAQYGVESYEEGFQVYAMTGANLRATPAQDGEIIQTIASGTGLKALGYTDRWYKVDLNGTIGYVNRNLFSDEPVQ